MRLRTLLSMTSAAALLACHGELLIGGEPDGGSSASDSASVSGSGGPDAASPTGASSGASPTGASSGASPTDASSGASPTGASSGGSPTDAIDHGCGSAAVSFGTDIMPIFQGGCTLASVCHGQMNNISEENLYLGQNGAGGGSADIQAVYSGLVGVASKEDPSMNLVAAGDPSKSYLWHKVYGDQNSNPSVASGCANAPSPCPDCNASTPCGGSQPYLGGVLGGADLCAIKNWIGQGAQNN
jgi:hypothetical protein